MENLKEKFNRITEDIARQLPEVENIPVEKCRQIIRRYTAAFEGNFVSWMGATAISTRSVEGRYASAENLYVEMRDNHAGMLRDFAISVQAEPDEEDYKDMYVGVTEIRNLVSEMSGLKNLALMATLESTSAAFIPWLAKIAQKCGSTNLHYTDVHGEADIEHANQFVWALEHEQSHFENCEQAIDETLEKTKQFILNIFKI